MAIREIIEDETFLRKKSRDVVVFDKRLHTLLDDMAHTLRDVNGVGIAAPQVGVLRRVVLINETGEPEDLLELINPVVIEASEEIQDDAEGCLSFPGEYGMVERPMHVKVRAQNRSGDLIILEGEGLKARAFCHEIDHLNGELFIEKASRMLDPEEFEERKKNRK
ncbi:MAG: peptide deformylase [Oscillospiraceae bacterium]|nr:peptide deformylase [Oscillospiraceae bacterium]